jgi:predicted N-formylglutamate amidohydrolase
MQKITNGFFEPDEVPPFTAQNEIGAAPMMIICDHASNRLPRNLGGMGLDTALLELHIAYDIGARQVAKILSNKFNAPLLLANYSRLVVDLNRHPGDPEMFMEQSDGHPVAGNECLDNESRNVRMASLFEPYHQKLESMLVRLRQNYLQPMIVSVHSFTDIFQEVERPWSFGVLWDRDEDLAIKLLANLSELGRQCQPPLAIGDNQPYHANSPQGYAMVAHAEKNNTEMALIEIRQDLICQNDGQHWAADILFDALNPLLKFTRN